MGNIRLTCEYCILHEHLLHNKVRSQQVAFQVAISLYRDVSPGRQRKREPEI